MALPPDADAPVCSDTNDVTLQSEFHVGWFHNSPAGTLSPDGHWLTPYNGGGSLAYGSFGSKVASAQPLVYGSGITGNVFYTSAYRIKGADQVSAADAYTAGDYITYQFTTSASVTSTDYFSSFGYGVHPTDGYPYRLTVLLSESPTFATASEIVSGHQVTNTVTPYEFRYAPTNQRIYVKPSTTYYMRLIIHDVQGVDPLNAAQTAAILDDPQIGMASCSTSPPLPAPYYGCSMAERRAAERWWYVGINQKAWDFGVSGANTPIDVSPAAVTMNADEGNLTVSDASGNLRFYSNGRSIWDKNHNVITNTLNGHYSANQSVVAATFDASPDRYVVVANGTGTNVQIKGLSWQIVDMSLNGGNGGAVGATQTIPGTAATVAGSPLLPPSQGKISEALYAVPNHDGTKAWVLTTSYTDHNLKAFEFDENGYTGTVVTSPLSSIHAWDTTGTSHINMTDDGTRIVTYGKRNGATASTSTHVALIVLDFNAQTGEAIERFTWDAPFGGGYGYYSTVFSKSGQYVYTTGYAHSSDWPERLYRYDISSGNKATIEATERMFHVGGSGLKRDLDGRIWNTRNGYLDDGDALNPTFVPWNLEGHFNLTAHVTTCPEGASAAAYDFGDAPDSYGDASHTIPTTPGIYLGSTLPDAETDTQNSANGEADGSGDDDTGSDDEDGVASFPALTTTTTGNYTLNVACNGNGANVYGWLDFNNNGSFANAGEFASATCSDTGAGNGSASLTFSGYTMATTAGDSYARIRITSDTLTSTDHDGLAADGEVEDYAVSISLGSLCDAQSGTLMQLRENGAETQLIMVEINNASSTFNTLGTTSNLLNGAWGAWKEGDGMAYGLVNGNVWRIDGNFNFTNLGSVTGGTTAHHQTGEILADGRLVSKAGNSNTLQVIDISSGAPTLGTAINLNRSLWTNDFAYNPVDGHLYGVDRTSQKLFWINLSNGNVTLFGPNYTGFYGAAWFDDQGNMYLYENLTGELLSVDTGVNGSGTGISTLVSTGVATTKNDGLSCRGSAPIAFDRSDSPASYGNTFHYMASGIRLGSAIDSDINDISSAAADADGADDDGIVIPALTTGATANLTVAVNGAGGYLQGWIDWNGDGDFADTVDGVSEQIALDLQDDGNNDDATASDGAIQIDVSVPASAITTAATFARFRWSTTQGLNSATQANNGEVEDYSISIATGSCTALSGDINRGLSPTMQIKNGDKLFLATTSTTNNDRQGHLEAFVVNGSGDTASTASWDAGEQMTVQERQNRLYSTATDGSLQLLQSLDNAAFDTNGLPDVTTIRAYTFDPNHDSGTYLNGRANDALLGSLSPEASLGLIGNTMNTMAFLDDPTYRSFFTSTVAARSDASNATKPSRVLVSSDDGFLYAFNQYDGDLGWGWMPRSLVAELKNHATFQNSHPMQGVLDVMDLKDSNGNYATYIIGSYKQGLGQYVLKLNADSSLNAVLSDTDHETSSSGLMDSAPQNGKRVYFTNAAGKVYAAYVVSDSDGGDSRLFIRSLTDATVTMEMPLNFVATSVPYVTPDFASSLAPPAKAIYLGSSTGDIHAASLLTSAGGLRSATAIQDELNAGAVAAMDSSTSSAVTFIGASSSGSDARFYLRAQSGDRLSVFSWQSSGSSWQRQWSAWTGGAASRTPGASTFSDASATIQTLPTGATITGEATIVANSIILPVTTEPAGNACYGRAWYYFYTLNDGSFPSQRFYTPGGSTAISNIVDLGYGAAQALRLMNIAGINQLQAIGMADQTTLNATGISVRMIIKEPGSYGIRSWRSLKDHH